KDENMWKNIVESEVKNKNMWKNGIVIKAKNTIKSQFLKLSVIKENINNIYTSKAYNITEINKSLLKLKGSKTM
ncbi:31912_t:CDS:1, partial [Gigaspora margarita]